MKGRAVLSNIYNSGEEKEKALNLNNSSADMMPCCAIVVLSTVASAMEASPHRMRAGLTIITTVTAKVKNIRVMNVRRTIAQTVRTITKSIF